MTELQMPFQTHDSYSVIEKLRQVRLRGSETIYPYRYATIQLRTVDPEFLSPCQRYVLSDELRKIERLRYEVKRYGQDMFNLYGYCEYGEWDILPPIIEEEWIHGRPYFLIADGQHRVYLAKQQQRHMTAVVITGADPEYYAYPLTGGWSGVEVINSLDENYIKKFHRYEDYKRYFRDFNTAFRKVGDSRKVIIKEGNNGQKDSGSGQTQASGSTSSPKTEVPLPPKFEIAVKSEKGRRIVIPETNVNNESE